MTDRILPINEAQIKVSINWDAGDPSVGINPGWGGEETGAEIKAGNFSTYIFFDVNIDHPVEKWFIDDMQTVYRFQRDDGSTGSKILLDEDSQAKPTGPPLQLLDFPDVCEAVRATWEQIQAIEAIEIAAEDTLGLKSAIDNLEWNLRENAGLANRPQFVAKLVEARKELADTQAKLDRLQTEYAEKFKDTETPRG